MDHHPFDENIDFDAHLEALQVFVTALQQRIHVDPNPAALTPQETFDALRQTLQGLHIANYELQQQTVELGATRLAIEAEQQKYQELFDFAPHGYVVTDSHGIIREANHAAAVLFNVSPLRLLGKPIAVFVVESDRQTFRQQLQTLPQVQRIEDWQVEMQPRERQAFAAALTVCSRQNRQRELLWIIRDVTEQNAAIEKTRQAKVALRHSREQLRHLATHLQIAQEQERARIARELHDDMAQTLTSLRLDVSWLSQQLGDRAEPVMQCLQNMGDTIVHLSQTTHRLSTDLRPQVLDDLGLSAAIEWQLQEIHRRTGLTYTVKLPTQEVVLDHARTTAVFRIFQEALTNVIRHAGATHIAVRLVQHSDIVLLEVADDGKGIAPEQLASQASSLGLLGMHERAQRWGGEVIVQRGEHEGTILSVRIPCDLIETGASMTEKESPVIRVLLADDHAAVREGARRFIAATTDLVVANEARQAQEVFDIVATGTCDVVLLDISLPGRDGLDTLKQLTQHYPDLPVLIYSAHPEDQYGVRAFRAGAAGYLSKDSEPETLLAALRKVAQGGRYVSPLMAERLAHDLTTDAADRPHTHLGDREFQVLRLLATGQTVTDIADSLSLSVKTVSTYRRRLLQKMHMKTNADLIHYAIQHQLVN
jgi:PAS domain S-box-containing protein